MSTTMKTLSALTFAAATLTAANLFASSSASAQVHGHAAVSVISSIHPGSPSGRLSAVGGVGIAPVVGKAHSSVGQWQCIPGAFGNCGPGPHRLSPIDGVGVVPVVGKPVCRGMCIPWQDSIWHPT